MDILPTFYIFRSVVTGAKICEQTQSEQQNNMLWVSKVCS